MTLFYLHAEGRCVVNMKKLWSESNRLVSNAIEPKVGSN